MGSCSQLLLLLHPQSSSPLHDGAQLASSVVQYSSLLGPIWGLLTQGSEAKLSSLVSLSLYSMVISQWYHPDTSTKLSTLVNVTAVGVGDCFRKACLETPGFKYTYIHVW